MLRRTTHSWTVPGIAHLECFRVVGFVHEFPRHSHSTWSLGVVDQGAGGIWFRGATERGGADEIITINPGEVHTGYPLQKSGLSYSMLYLGEELLRDILPGAAAMPNFPGITVRDTTLPMELRQLCRRLEFCCPCLEAETQLFTCLARVFRQHAHAKAATHTGNEPGHVARMQEYLRANAQRNVRLQELAEITGFSKAYTIRSFRRLVGMPPYEWLLQLRIEKAKRLLQSGRPVSEVAASLGFADQSHFHRRFKRITGMTPAAYAKGHYRSRQDQGSFDRIDRAALAGGPQIARFP
jgi:AraC-like DNA-binding protein